MILCQVFNFLFTVSVMSKRFYQLNCVHLHLHLRLYLHIYIQIYRCRYRCSVDVDAGVVQMQMQIQCRCRCRCRCSADVDVDVICMQNFHSRAPSLSSILLMFRSKHREDTERNVAHAQNELDGTFNDRLIPRTIFDLSQMKKQII